MVFSLFGRKPGSGAAEPPGAAVDRPADPRADARALAERRERARRMAATIDRIESEMMGSKGGAEADVVPPAPAGPAAPAHPAGDPAHAGILVASSGLSPEIEAAAILWANGQPQQAAEALGRLVARDAPGDRVGLGWPMLFDALRACDAREAFEAAAREYRARVGAMPPLWRSSDASDCPASEPVDCALGGELVGLDPPQLGVLAACVGSAGRVAVDCRALTRIDFPAAGALLNTVMAMHGAGREVVFVEPAAAVEALMTIMGIHEFATIRRRRIPPSFSPDGSARP